MKLKISNSDQMADKYLPKLPYVGLLYLFVHMSSCYNTILSIFIILYKIISQYRHVISLKHFVFICEIWVMTKINFNIEDNLCSIHTFFSFIQDSKIQALLTYLAQYKKLDRTFLWQYKRKRGIILITLGSRRVYHTPDTVIIDSRSLKLLESTLFKNYI